MRMACQAELVQRGILNLRDGSDRVLKVRGRGRRGLGRKAGVVWSEGGRQGLGRVGGGRGWGEREGGGRGWGEREEAGAGEGGRDWREREAGAGEEGREGGGAHVASVRAQVCVCHVDAALIDVRDARTLMCTPCGPKRDTQTTPIDMFRSARRAC